VSLRVDIELRGVDGVLELLKQLPPEVVGKRGGPVKAALRKAAQVIHRAAKANLQAAVAAAKDGDEQLSTGLLIKNLVVTRGKEPSGGNGERYLVRVRRKSYQRKGQSVTTLKTAQLLEYGSSKQPAEPWLRPAFESRARAAISTAEVELAKAIDRAVRKLSRGGAR
jgi:HK97 gp10 family phage protein